MKIIWSNTQLPESFPDAISFADGLLRSSTAYSPSGKFGTNRFHFCVSLLLKDYRQEFTAFPWRKPNSKQPNLPYGTTHVLSYDVRFPSWYESHPSNVIIAQGHTAGEGKLPVWTLSVWGIEGELLSMGPNGERVKSTVHKGQLVLSTHCYGLISSNGSRIANRIPLDYYPIGGVPFDLLIQRKAALKKDGGLMDITVNGKNLISLNADMVYPDELLCDNWKVGIYYPEIKTSYESQENARREELIAKGYSYIEYSIGDFTCVEILPNDTKALPELITTLTEYWEARYHRLRSSIVSFIQDLT